MSAYAAPMERPSFFRRVTEGAKRTVTKVKDTTTRVARRTWSLTKRVTGKSTRVVKHGAHDLGYGAVWLIGWVLATAVGAVAWIVLGAWLLVGLVVAAVVTGLHHLTMTFRVWSGALFERLFSPVELSLAEWRMVLREEYGHQDLYTKVGKKFGKLTDKLNDTKTSEDDDWGMVDWADLRDRQYVAEDEMVPPENDWDPIIITHEPAVTSVCYHCKLAIMMDIEGNWFHSDPVDLSEVTIADIDHTASPIAEEKDARDLFDSCIACGRQAWLDTEEGRWRHIHAIAGGAEEHEVIPSRMVAEATEALPLEEPEEMTLAEAYAYLDNVSDPRLTTEKARAAQRLVEEAEAPPVEGEPENPILKKMGRWLHRHKDASPMDFAFKGNWTYEDQYEALHTLHNTAKGNEEQSYWLGRLEALTAFHKDERALDRSIREWSLVFTRYQGGNKVKMNALRDGFNAMIADLKVQTGWSQQVAASS